MNLRWLWFDHFPPELMLTREQKRTARNLASRHRKREPNYRGAQTRSQIYSIPLMIIAFSAYWFWQNNMIATRRLSTAMSSAFFLIVIYGPLAFGMHRTRTPFIRRALRDMGFDLCEDCGYWLRDLRDDVKHCPECGSPRQPMPSAVAEKPS